MRPNTTTTSTSTTLTSTVFLHLLEYYSNRIVCVLLLVERYMPGSAAHAHHGHRVHRLDGEVAGGMETRFPVVCEVVESETYCGPLQVVNHAAEELCRLAMRALRDWGVEGGGGGQ